MKTKYYPMKSVKILCIAALALCVSCKQNRGGAFVRSVKTAVPVSMGATAERSLPGIVKENQTVNLGFKAQGQIQRIYVRAGDYVREGQMLAKIDDKDYRLQLSATEIQYNQLKTEVERLEELYKRNGIPGNDYEKAAAGLEAMGVQLEGNRRQVEYTSLRSPASGYIQSVNFRESEMVDAGRPVFTLLDTSSLVVETDLPADLYMQRGDFGTVSCRANLLPGEQFPLKLLSISHKSSGSQLYKMQLTIAGASRTPLSAGMNVEVAIELRQKDAASDACTLPVNSVFAENGKHYIWIVSGSESAVHKKEVAVSGLDDSGSIIVTGVTPADRVVSAGVQYLQEGEKVNVISQSETNIGGLL